MCLQWCTDLRHLDLRFCRNVTIAGVAALAKHCPRITALCLFGIDTRDKATVNKLLSHLPNLERIDMWSQPTSDDINLLAVRCPRLTSLALDLFCVSVSLASHVALHNSYLQLTSKALEVLAKRCPLRELGFGCVRTSPEKLSQVSAYFAKGLFG